MEYKLFKETLEEILLASAVRQRQFEYFSNNLIFYVKMTFYRQRSEHSVNIPQRETRISKIFGLQRTLLLQY